MVRFKKWLLYLVYVVILISYMFFTNSIQYTFSDKYYRFEIGLFIYLFTSTIIYVVLGMLLGLESFLSRKAGAGRWKINVPKVLLLGIPFLYFSIGPFIYLTPVLSNSIVVLPIKIILTSSNLIQVFQIILGYIIITSFVKEI